MGGGRDSAGWWSYMRTLCPPYNPVRAVLCFRGLGMKPGRIFSQELFGIILLRFCRPWVNVCGPRHGMSFFAVDLLTATPSTHADVRLCEEWDRNMGGFFVLVTLFLAVFPVLFGFAGGLAAGNSCASGVCGRKFD